MDLTQHTNTITQLQKQGQTVMLLASDREILALIGVADPIKSSSYEAIEQLKLAGVEVIMLTGDNEHTARAVSEQLKLNQFKSDVLPEYKFTFIKTLQSQGKVVAMAGDGVNDAPALTQADVGIAMGTGTDIAMNSAKVVLVKGDLRGIAKAKHLSQHTLKNIRQNLFFAFIYNALGVPVAAGLLYPLLGLVMSPMFAGAAMSLSSVSVITNALRLKKAKL
jgi:P-type E1-E2 ATPase